jgi:RNA polymerase sigma factor (sigma-70 family)
MRPSSEPLEPSETLDLVAKCREGDKEAERLLFERYVQRLHRLATAKVPPGMERRFGADDVVQSVLLSFCRAIRNDHIDLKRSGDLWAWLVRITFNKLNSRLKHNLAARRSVQREVDVPSSVDSGEGLTSAFLSQEPAIEELEEVLDEIDYLFGPRDALLRRVVDLRLQDLSKSEIAERLGVSHTTVNRHLKKIALVLQERCQSLAG